MAVNYRFRNRCNEGGKRTGDRKGLILIIAISILLQHKTVLSSTPPTSSTSISAEGSTKNSSSIGATGAKLTLIFCSRDVRQGIRAFQYWSSVLVIPLAVLGTGLVVLGTFTHLKTNSANVYMFLLSIFDTGTIIGHKIYYFYSYYAIDLGSNFACKFVQYVMNVFHVASIWTLVFMTMERVFVVYRPLKATVKCRPKYAVYITLTILLVMACISSSLLWEFDLVNVGDNKPRFCDIVNLELYRAMTWVRDTLQCFAPMTILSLSNVAIVQRLSRQNKARSGLSSQNTERQTEKQRVITVMLLATSITYVILTFPYAVKFILDAYWNFSQNCRDMFIYHIYNSIVYRLQDIIHCINGYIYIITSQKFRAEVLKRFRELPTGHFSKEPSLKLGSVSSTSTKF